MRSDGREGRVSRRGLFTAAGAVAGGALGASGTAAHESISISDDSASSAELADRAVVGILEAKLAPDRFVVRRSVDSTERATVILSQSAHIHRERVATLADFVVGEEVACEGRHLQDGVFEATSLECMYRLVEATVRERRGDRLETTRGGVVMTSQTRPRSGQVLGHRLVPKSPGSIRAGDTIIVAGRREPETGALVAVTVGVVEG